ncbi:MAG TPA: polyprenyl synthetase family protein, partial [Candidatus Altiarchaeales archaeon]|nr:polyprenyl synthetase family protein [Candidatus Altiarchaeales archaeon]
MKGIDDILNIYGALIEKRTEEFLRQRTKEADSYHGFISEVYRNLREYVMRSGKRLASCSTLLVYKGYTDKIDNSILKACVGIELYRHSILIHDDLVDRDDFRRGGKAFHKIFDNISRRFGESTAILSGNILYSLALDAILESNFDRDLVYEAINLINKDYGNVNESQILDILFEYKEIDSEEWYKMASKRASSLFKATMLTGAILANAPQEEKDLLIECSSHIGYSFDIQDDIIGTFGTEEEYGRPIGGDVVLGKKSLHVVYALENSPENESKELRRILKKENPTEDEINEAIEIMRKYGMERAKERSREHARKAINLIKKTQMSEETKN